MRRLSILISDGLGRYAKARFIVPCLALVVSILALMENGPFGIAKLRSLSGGTGMLDMMFGYSPPVVHGLLEKIGGAGRLLYSRLLLLDFAFAVAYTALQALLITALLRKAAMDGLWKRLNLLPFVRSLLDFVENGILLFVLNSFPEYPQIIVYLASAITLVKLILNYGYMVLVFFLGALSTRRSILSKRREAQA